MAIEEFCDFTNCKCRLPKTARARAALEADPFYSPVTNNAVYEREKAMAEVTAKLKATANKIQRKKTVNLILDADGLAKYITETIGLQDKTKRVRIRPTVENDYQDFKTVDKRPDEMTTGIESIRVNADGKFVVEVPDYTLDQLYTKKNRDSVAASFGTPTE